LFCSHSFSAFARTPKTVILSEGEAVAEGPALPLPLLSSLLLLFAVILSAAKDPE
jgi:hypothetical protein